MIVALVCWVFAFCATAFLGFFKNVVAPWYVRGDNLSDRPYGTDPFLRIIQAINCLDFGELSRVATIIQSLRDADTPGSRLLAPKAFGRLLTDRTAGRQATPLRMISARCPRTVGLLQRENQVIDPYQIIG